MNKRRKNETKPESVTQTGQSESLSRKTALKRMALQVAGLAVLANQAQVGLDNVIGKIPGDTARNLTECREYIAQNIKDGKMTKRLSSPLNETIAKGNGLMSELWPRAYVNYYRYRSYSSLSYFSYYSSYISYYVVYSSYGSGYSSYFSKYSSYAGQKKSVVISPLLRKSFKIEGYKSIAYSPDGKTIVSCGRGKIRIWDANGKRKAILKEIHYEVQTVAFSPDGKTIASGGGDEEIKIWDVNDRKLLATLTGHSGKITTISFSPDGRTIASGDDKGSIKIWDLASGKLLKTLTGAHYYINIVAFSPDGRYIASGGFNKSYQEKDTPIKIWDLASGNLLKELKGHSSGVTNITFSPDGSSIISGSTDRTIKIWDVSSGNLLRTLTGHLSDVWGVAISPDSKTIASASNDQTVKIWNAVNGKLIETLTGHSNSVFSVAFSPDSRTIMSCCYNGQLIIWDVPDSIKTQTKLPTPLSTPKSYESRSKLVFADSQHFTNSNGVVNFDGGDEGYFSDYVPSTIPTDFTAKVSVKWNGGVDDNGFGIVFRQDDKSSYFFQIAANGQYRLSKLEYNKKWVWVYLTKWTSTDTVKLGFNQLEVTCMGKSIICSINGIEVINIEDAPPSASKMGIGIGSNSGIKCSFSDFEVAY